MKTFASLITLFAACASAPAPATNTTPVASRGPTCSASGDVAFEIDRALGSEPESSTIIYASGAWRTTNNEGRGTSGCLTDVELETVRRDIATSTWEHLPLSGAQCHMRTLERTTYKVNGATVWESEGCPNDRLDDVSARNFGELLKVVETATSRPAAQAHAHAFATR